MATISITLNGIDQAIANLAYRQNSIKNKIVSAIRSFYTSEDSIKQLNSIDTDILIKSIWDVGDNFTKIKAKRRNFSSLISSINADLKKLSIKELNSENIMISTLNIFDMSEEAKSELLKAFAGKSPIAGLNIEQTTELLEIVTKSLDISKIENKEMDHTELVERIKNILTKITKENVSEEISESISQLKKQDIESDKDETHEKVKGSDKDADEKEIEEPEEIKSDGADGETDSTDDKKDDKDDDDTELDEIEEIDDDAEVIDLDDDEEIEEIEEIDDEDIEEIEGDGADDEGDVTGGGGDGRGGVGDGTGGRGAGTGGGTGGDKDSDDTELDDIEEIDDDAEVIDLDDDEDLEEIDELDEDEIKALEEFREQKERAEFFDNELGEREKKFNKYVIVPKGEYTVGTKKSLKSNLGLQQFDMPQIYFGAYPVTNSLFEIFVEQTGYITSAEKSGYGTVYHSRFKKNTNGSSWNKNAGSEDINGACWHKPFGPESTLHNKRNHPVVQVSMSDAIAFGSWI